MWRVALFAGAVCLVALSTATPGPAPVSAHQGAEACQPLYYGGPNRGTACNRYTGYGNHWENYIDGCDREADGWKVRAWADLNDPINHVPGEWDPNGANSGCANDRLYGARLEGHRICVEVAGCSAWRPHGYP
jgi:hypothetical protein